MNNDHTEALAFELARRALENSPSPKIAMRALSMAIVVAANETLPSDERRAAVADKIARTSDFTIRRVFELIGVPIPQVSLPADLN